MSLEAKKSSARTSGDLVSLTLPFETFKKGSLYGTLHGSLQILIQRVEEKHYSKRADKAKSNAVETRKFHHANRIPNKTRPSASAWIPSETRIPSSTPAREQRLAQKARLERRTTLTQHGRTIKPSQELPAHRGRESRKELHKLRSSQLILRRGGRQALLVRSHPRRQIKPFNSQRPSHRVDFSAATQRQSAPRSYQRRKKSTRTEAQGHGKRESAPKQASAFPKTLKLRGGSECPRRRNKQ